MRNLKNARNNEAFVELFYQISGLDPDASHPVLQEVHLTPYPAFMQVYSYLF